MTAEGAFKLLISNPRLFFESLLRIPFISRVIPDRTFITILYIMRFKRRINLDNPRTFNEKLLWLTLYDRKPEGSSQNSVDFALITVWNIRNIH